MSAPTTFKPSIRDAGELTDHRIYGSFRSLHRFEAPIHKSKHEDIFRSKEYESSLPPKATNNSENQEKKNSGIFIYKFLIVFFLVNLQYMSAAICSLSLRLVQQKQKILKIYFLLIN